MPAQKQKKATADELVIHYIKRLTTDAPDRITDVADDIKKNIQPGSIQQKTLYILFIKLIERYNYFVSVINKTVDGGHAAKYYVPLMTIDGVFRHFKYKSPIIYEKIPLRDTASFRLKPVPLTLEDILPSPRQDKKPKRVPPKRQFYAPHGNASKPEQFDVDIKPPKTNKKPKKLVHLTDSELLARMPVLTPKEVEEIERSKDKSKRVMTGVPIVKITGIEKGAWMPNSTFDKRIQELNIKIAARKAAENKNVSVSLEPFRIGKYTGYIPQILIRHVARMHFYIPFFITADITPLATLVDRISGGGPLSTPAIEMQWQRYNELTQTLHSKNTKQILQLALNHKYTTQDRLHAISCLSDTESLIKVLRAYQGYYEGRLKHEGVAAAISLIRTGRSEAFTILTRYPKHFKAALAIISRMQPSTLPNFDHKKVLSALSPETRERLESAKISELVKHANSDEPIIRLAVYCLIASQYEKDIIPLIHHSNQSVAIAAMTGVRSTTDIGVARTIIKRVQTGYINLRIMAALVLGDILMHNSGIHKSIGGVPNDWRYEHDIDEKRSEEAERAGDLCKIIRETLGKLSSSNNATDRILAEFVKIRNGDSRVDRLIEGISHPDYNIRFFCARFVTRFSDIDDMSTEADSAKIKKALESQLAKEKNAVVHVAIQSSLLVFEGQRIRPFEFVEGEPIRYIYEPPTYH